MAQTISYEVRLALILIAYILILGSFNLRDFCVIQDKCNLFIISLPLTLMWFVSILAETNRTPFDFAEGESELVSGFNIEYSRGGFALIFIAEYARILFIRFLFSIIFLGPNDNFYLICVKAALVAFGFIWVRGTLPRLRYDKLINLA